METRPTCKEFEKKAGKVFYDTLIQTTLDGFWLVSTDGKLFDVNSTYSVMSGYSKAELLNMSIPDLEASETANETANQISNIITTGSDRFETVHRRKDGSTFQVEISTTFLPTENQLIVFIRDISKRKQAEDALRVSEENYRMLFERANDAIFVYHTSPAGMPSKFIKTNQKAAEMLGYSREELLTFSPNNLVIPARLHEIPRIVEEKKKKGGDCIFEITLLCKDGRCLDVEISDHSFIVMDTPYTLSIVRDITERKQIEAQLIRAKEEWENTFDAMSDIITIQDKDMHIVRANKAAHEFFQVQHGELNVNHCYEMFTGVSAPCQGCPLVKTLQDGNEHSVIVTHENLGKIFHISSAVVSAVNGEIAYIVHVAKDITEQKKMEEDLFQAHKMEAMGTLAGGIAHDFNNILSAILGFSAFVKHDLPEDSKARQNIEQVISSGQRAAELVEQILTFSHKADLQQHPLLPHLIIKEAMKMLRSTLPATIAVEEHIDLECGSILANPTNVHQIVVNLCTNAYHAMVNEKGTLTVTLSRTEIRKEDSVENDVSPGPFVELSIQDTGKGMDNKTMSRIFEPYFTTKDIGKGSGLGLAVIHGIVKTLHGFIRVESELGKGSTFHVYIPVLEDVAATSVEIEQKSIPMGTERILVVDDESIIVHMNTMILEQLGYTVTATTSSVEALEKIRTQPDDFDLVITDQAMPNLSGAELAQEILKIKPNMPIILCTGYSSVLSKEDTLAIGINKYVKKPVDKETVAKVVRKVLDDHKE